MSWHQWMPALFCWVGATGNASESALNFNDGTAFHITEVENRP